MAILAFAHVTNPSELPKIPDELELSEAQRALLVEHRAVLGLVGGDRPVVSVACCPECGRWSFSASGAGGAGCRLTLGCAGKPRRAVAAKKQIMENPLFLVVNNVDSQPDQQPGDRGGSPDPAPADFLVSDEEDPVFVDFGDEYVDEYAQESAVEDLSKDFPI